MIYDGQGNPVFNLDTKLEQSSTTISAAGRGNFTAGEFTFVKIGNVVTLMGTGLEHENDSTPQVPAGFITPGLYAPDSSFFDVMNVNGDGLINILVYNSQQFIRFYYYDWSGTLDNSGSTSLSGFSVSYIADDFS